MEPLHVAHLMVLGMWLGVVITEVLFEFAASDAESLRAAARFHYKVDKFGELPILLAVIVTGTILAVRAWPLTPLHVIKIAASLVAVGVNLICTMWVFQRRRIEDVNVLLGFRRRIWSLAAVGVVFATPSISGWSISGSDIPELLREGVDAIFGSSFGDEHLPAGLVTIIERRSA